MRAAAQHGTDPLLALSVAQHETANPGASSFSDDPHAALANMTAVHASNPSMSPGQVAALATGNANNPNYAADINQLYATNTAQGHALNGTSPLATAPPAISTPAGLASTPTNANTPAVSTQALRAGGTVSVPGPVPMAGSMTMAQAAAAQSAIPMTAPTLTPIKAATFANPAMPDLGTGTGIHQITPTPVPGASGPEQAAVNQIANPNVVNYTKTPTTNPFLAAHAAVGRNAQQMLNILATQGSAAAQTYANGLAQSRGANTAAVTQALSNASMTNAPAGMQSHAASVAGLPGSLFSNYLRQSALSSAHAEGMLTQAYNQYGAEASKAVPVIQAQTQATVASVQAKAEATLAGNVATAQAKAAQNAYNLQKAALAVQQAQFSDAAAQARAQSAMASAQGAAAKGSVELQIAQTNLAIKQQGLAGGAGGGSQIAIPGTNVSITDFGSFGGSKKGTSPVDVGNAVQAAASQGLDPQTAADDIKQAIAAAGFNMGSKSNAAAVNAALGAAIGQYYGSAYLNSGGTVLPAGVSPAIKAAAALWAKA
ncbi:MAG: hypothetical protein ACRD6B_03860 [Bryobacteraceae bacterium]